METQTFVSVLLPMALAFIMFTLGLSLTVEDFKRIVRFPKPVLIGLAIQIVILPAFAFLLCKGFSIPPEYSVGILLLAASPGGSTANIFSHLSGGDVALNLTLTAINAMTAIFLFPIIASAAIQHFMGETQAIGPQLSKFIEVFAIILIPVSIGMFVSSRAPKRTREMEGLFKKISTVLLAVVCLGAIAKERGAIASAFGTLGLLLLIFNVGSMLIGYLVPRGLKLSRPQSIAIAMELGIHNATFALYVALTIFGSFSYALPIAVYSIIMFITASLTAFYFSRTAKNA